MNRTIEPIVWFVGNDGATLHRERDYGDHRLVEKTIIGIGGSDPSVVIGTNSTLMTSSGAAWEPETSYGMVGGYTSVTMIGGGFTFATNGKQIAEPGNARVDVDGAIAQIFAYKRSLLAIGAGGAVLHRAAEGTYEKLDTTESVDLTAGCATSAGNLWVGGGKRVFRRRDVIR